MCMWTKDKILMWWVKQTPQEMLLQTPFSCPFSLLKVSVVFVFFASSFFFEMESAWETAYFFLCRSVLFQLKKFPYFKSSLLSVCWLLAACIILFCLYVFVGFLRLLLLLLLKDDSLFCFNSFGNCFL